MLDIKQSHSKSKSLIYKEFALQDYLKPASQLTIQEKCFIFAARSRMLDLKCNFKVGKSDLKCRKCFREDENQEHILFCPALSDNSALPITDQISYNDINGQETDKITHLGKILMTKFKNLHQVHSSDTSAATNCKAVELD